MMRVHKNGTDRDATPEEEAGIVATQAETASYEVRRKAEYASTEDQLDMIYWDQVNGTTTFKDHRAAVKAKYPKPE